MLKDFKAFILRGNVVDLAVGVVIGAAFGAIVNSIVTGLINPIISFVTPGEFAKKAFCIGKAVVKDKETGKPVCAHLFGYGGVITSVISFVLIAAVVFFLVVKPVNNLMTKLKGDEDRPTDRQCPECLSHIPVAATRCAFCTTKVGAPA